MGRLSGSLWFALLLILLLPTAAGRFLLDLAGGIMVFVVALPFLVGGVGWIAWRILQSRMIRCETCGISILNTSSNCPACGSKLQQGSNRKGSKSQTEESIPASEATIDITPKDTE